MNEITELSRRNAEIYKLREAETRKELSIMKELIDSQRHSIASLQQRINTLDEQLNMMRAMRAGNGPTSR